MIDNLFKQIQSKLEIFVNDNIRYRNKQRIVRN